jgi:Hypervirulence associated proteins TUDOR domain
MTGKFKVGDHVRWNSEAGHVSGKIIKVHTKDFDYKGYTHRASKDEPQYEIKKERQVRAHRHAQGLGAAYSPNVAWLNASFRGYADHIGSAEFSQGLDELLELSGRRGMVALPPGADRGCAVRPRYWSSAYPRCEGHRRASLHAACSHHSRPAELCTSGRRGIIAPTSATSHKTSFIVDSFVAAICEIREYLRCDRRLARTLNPHGG